MIDPYYNPLTGEGLPMADLYTVHGEKIPKDLLGFFRYKVNGEGENEMLINGIYRSLYYLREDICGEEEEKKANAKEQYPGYTQEKICEILEDVENMISYDYNPLTGEGRSLEDNIPKELVYLFDYEVGDEMAFGMNARACIVENYHEYCYEDITSDKIDKKKLKKMKKHFNMGRKSQKEMCKIIKNTCNLIRSDYNPYTGEGLSNATLYTVHGEKIPKDLLGFFKYNVNGDGENEMVINGQSRSLYYLYEDICGEEMGTIEKEKKSNAYEKYPGYTQEKICEILVDIDSMISYDYNPLTGEGKDKSIYIEA